MLNSTIRIAAFPLRALALARALTSSYSSPGPCLPFYFFLFLFPPLLSGVLLVHPPYLSPSPFLPRRSRETCVSSTCRSSLPPFSRVRYMSSSARSWVSNEMLEPERRNPLNDTDNCVQFASRLVAASARRFPRTVVRFSRRHTFPPCVSRSWNIKVFIWHK